MCTNKNEWAWAKAAQMHCLYNRICDRSFGIELCLLWIYLLLLKFRNILCTLENLSILTCVIKLCCIGWFCHVIVRSPLEYSVLWRRKAQIVGRDSCVLYYLMFCCFHNGCYVQIMNYLHGGITNFLHTQVLCRIKYLIRISNPDLLEVN